MVSLVDSSEYSSGYELGDSVWFKLPYTDRYVCGEVVRVYNTRYNYHVYYNGNRYHTTIDEMSRSEPQEEGEY